MLGDKRSLTVCYQNGCYTCVCFDTESGQYAGGIDNILIATDKKIIVPKCKLVVTMGILTVYSTVMQNSRLLKV